MKFDCLLTKEATSLAHRRGLLDKNKVIDCPYLDSCDGSSCQRIKDGPVTRRIYLLQTGTATPPDIVNRFYNRIETTLNMRSSR